MKNKILTDSNLFSGDVSVLDLDLPDLQPEHLSTEGDKVVFMFGLKALNKGTSITKKDVEKYIEKISNLRNIKERIVLGVPVPPVKECVSLADIANVSRYLEYNYYLEHLCANNMLLYKVHYIKFEDFRQ